jgi:hypothetical protein
MNTFRPMNRLSEIINQKLQQNNTAILCVHVRCVVVEVRGNVVDIGIFISRLNGSVMLSGFPWFMINALIV